MEGFNRVMIAPLRGDFVAHERGVTFLKIYLREIEFEKSAILLFKLPIFLYSGPPVTLFYGYNKKGFYGKSKHNSNHVFFISSNE